MGTQGPSTFRRLARGAGWTLLGLALLAVLVLAGFRAAAGLRERGAAMPAHERLVQTGLGRIAVAVDGPAGGPPVLLVHGSAGWSGFWKDVAAHLAGRGWRVYAVDLPPFGWSDHDPAGRYDRVTQAERLAGVIHAVGGGRAVVVAHSFGAGTATELALRHPDAVRALVLVDAALGTLDGPAAKAPLAVRTPGLAAGLTAATVTNPMATGPLLRAMLARKQAAAPWLATLQAPMRREGTTAAYTAWLPNLFATDDGAFSRRSTAIAAIRVPVAIVWGGADTVTPIAQGRRLAALTHARSFTVLPGSGHIPHIEDPERFLAALDAALAPDRKGDK